jgi:hypothetical protein
MVAFTQATTNEGDTYRFSTVRLLSTFNTFL